MNRIDTNELEMIYESMCLETALSYYSNIASSLTKRESPVEVVRKMCVVLKELKKDSANDQVFKQMEKGLIDFVNLTSGYQLLSSIEWGKTPSFYDDVIKAIQNNSKK